MPNKIKVLVAVSMFFGTVACINLNVLAYLYNQACGQLEILWNARPLTEIMDAPSVSVKFKERIALVGDVKAFASEQLGMNASSLFNSLYDQKGKDILWNVSACPPFSFQQKKWSFPIVGEVSYKGFFDLEKAKKEAQKLAERGYDTRIRPVNAWSTLGWFDDPILSKTIQREVGDMAELFIHEITHLHVFYEDSLQYNENLASFVGKQGTLLFVKARYGDKSEEYKSYINCESDNRLFTQYCLAELSQLGDLYQCCDAQMSIVDKMRQKKLFLQLWVAGLCDISFSENSNYTQLFENKLPNNAFFMAFYRYSSKQDELMNQLILDFDGDLRQLIQFHKQQKKRYNP